MEQQAPQPSGHSGIEFTRSRMTHLGSAIGHVPDSGGARFYRTRVFTSLAVLLVGAYCLTSYLVGVNVTEELQVTLNEEIGALNLAVTEDELQHSVMGASWHVGLARITPGQPVPKQAEINMEIKFKTMPTLWLKTTSEKNRRDEPWRLGDIRLAGFSGKIRFAGKLAQELKQNWKEELKISFSGARTLMDYNELKVSLPSLTRSSNPGALAGVELPAGLRMELISSDLGILMRRLSVPRFQAVTPNGSVALENLQLRTLSHLDEMRGDGQGMFALNVARFEQKGSRPFFLKKVELTGDIARLPERDSFTPSLTHAANVWLSCLGGAGKVSECVVPSFLSFVDTPGALQLQLLRGELFQTPTANPADRGSYFLAKSDTVKSRVLPGQSLAAKQLVPHKQMLLWKTPLPGQVTGDLQESTKGLRVAELPLYQEISRAWGSSVNSTLPVKKK